MESGISLSNEDHLLRINYLFDQAQVIVLEGQDIGLLKVDEQGSNIEIVQIQIDPKFQGKGIGRQVVSNVIDKSKVLKKNVSLSVLKENKARELYLRIGFKIIGEDDNSFIMLFDHNAKE
jgi:ribosomal protein S18 acetylase RimI-like enzyme